MITTLIVAVCALLLGYAAGASTELRRVLDYLDAHLDRDADWLRSGLADDAHHPRARGRSQ